ncbi:uncharacterized protein CANTADRAFT_22034 [Suhomyces tanzawaensis NRRL Y-17324]|uniref:Localizes primarily to the nucleolus n=1 Tax=Suhomyces tanzawaensis NRRL Y-17324 TaxID=984487 RepID=A0A1E4SIE6_9ASCO|nr:uncharacterized protein CANTADRAFT_22034 [Suhomyces tanzawaensis NRRL Y-17324]ODV79283.1 hypothetical protein CANTADRAFT_22034 [Suhomyces tanzawaensis NRRL Y-17324]
MSSVDEILAGILASVGSTKSSIDELTKNLDQEQYPQIVQTLLSKIGENKLEGVSLLALKNNSLVSYLNNVVMVILSHLERLEGQDVENDRLETIQRSIVQRVNLEKGIKPLEKKLNYQLDKMVKAYNRMEADEEKAEEKLNRIGSDSEAEDDDDDDSEDSDEDNLSYKPDAAALAKMSRPSDDRKKSSSNEKYKPPKISAVAPPTSISKEDGKDKGRNRKLQSMEEYLREQSDMPTTEASIGSTIVDHGRGGVKTQHDRRKEKEIQEYEESNFIRLSNNQVKKSFKEKQRDRENQFGGEDWSMFNQKNTREVSGDTSRKRKPNTVWDRVKKRKN